MKQLIAALLLALPILLNAQQACEPTADLNQDGVVGISDLLNLLSAFGDTDLDFDGIYDSVDDCVGAYDECGVCNGPGPQVLGIDTIIVYYDSLYAEAIDEWWVFEVDADTLLTYLCENPGCTDPTADNYDPYAIEEDNSCVRADGSPVCDYQNSIIFDDYTYELVAIGEQCWFAENLRTRIYANGDSIPSNLSSDEWVTTTIGAVAVYGEGESICSASTSAFGEDACDVEWSLNEYGRLYNWYAVDDSRDLCPTGWHVPTDGEWMEMEIELGMTVAQANGYNWRGTDQGTQMKTDYGWDIWGDMVNGTNSSGFTALPGGDRSGVYGNFDSAGKHTYWWIPASSWYRSLNFNSEQVNRSANMWLNQGISVRCLKD